MKLRLSIWSVVVVAVALSSVVLLSSDQAMASNMGFKMNKVIVATGLPPIGENRVALPYRNPYNTAQDICVALGLTAATGKVQQLNAVTGVTSAHTCGNPGPYTLTQRVGIIVSNPSAAGGILVGSHASNPPGTITIRKAGLPPVGNNHFPVPYHTTDVTAQDLCTDLAIPALSTVKQLNAATGVTSSHTCGNPGPYTLTLGESALIVMPGTQLTDIVVAAGHPAHF